MPAPAVCIPHAVFGHGVDHVAGEDDVADEAITRAAIPRLYRCVARLPARERAVIVRHFGLGCQARGLREVAVELGVSVGTVHTAERHALELLREWF